MKRTLLVALCMFVSLAVGQALQAETAPAAPESGCASATIAQLVQGPWLSPVRAAEPAAQADPFDGGSGTDACCSLAERNECYNTFPPGCAHWYCDGVCICENIC